MCVSDNAMNMVNGVTNAGITHLSCFLHTLHLIVKKSIFCQPGVDSLIKKCKSIVTSNKRSSTEKYLFENLEIEEENDTSKYRLHQMVNI